MLPLIEDFGIGAALIAVAATGLACAAAYFRRVESTGDRFFSTSLTSVALVALVVTGAFCIGRAAVEVGGALTLVIAVAGIAYTIAVPVVAWRWFGPRPEAGAARAAA